MAVADKETVAFPRLEALVFSFTADHSAQSAVEAMPAGNMESVESRPQKGARPDSLALLYQNVFTGIVRLQAGRQRLNDLVAFRRRIIDALQDVQKGAAAAGYRSSQVRDAEMAVVAFLDEAVLSLKDNARDAWAKQTLSLELYGESNAGEVFYERLNELSGDADSHRLADLLEVYLLCLLLGFEGKFSGSMHGLALRISDGLRRRIETIRGSDYRLAPPLQFADPTPQSGKPKSSLNRRRLWLVGLLGCPFLLFALFRIYLWVRVSGLLGLLQEWR
jgi:type VI secretion system protein ImpK